VIASASNPNKPKLRGDGLGTTLVLEEGLDNQFVVPDHTKMSLGDGKKAVRKIFQRAYSTSQHFLYGSVDCNSNSLLKLDNFTRAETTIPWSAMTTGSHAHRVTSESLPTLNGAAQPFVIKEPSKFNKSEITGLLAHWKSRQESGHKPVVWVHASSGTPPLPEESEEEESDSSLGTVAPSTLKSKQVCSHLLSLNWSNDNLCFTEEVSI
jgi:hypothetical protein